MNCVGPVSDTSTSRVRTMLATEQTALLAACFRALFASVEAISCFKRTVSAVINMPSRLEKSFVACFMVKNNCSRCSFKERTRDASKSCALPLDPLSASRSPGYDTDWKFKTKWLRRLIWGLSTVMASHQSGKVGCLRERLLPILGICSQSWLSMPSTWIQKGPLATNFRPHISVEAGTSKLPQSHQGCPMPQSL